MPGDSAHALPPPAALRLAAALLAERGFREVARNDRGDSLYLAQPGSPASLRLSNHARRPRQRRSHPEVMASLVIRAPRTAGQVADLVEAALRDFSAGLRRAGAPS